MKSITLALFLLSPLFLFSQTNNTILEEVTHGYADNNGVKIHYASIGEGPLVVMLHGFPDYWYTWRDQMAALKDDFQVVAMDLRGYNLSGQPEGVENYQMQHLMQDVVAVIQSFGKEKAIIIGHDWGGGIAWQLAIHRPEVVEKLIVCNLTHPTPQAAENLRVWAGNNNTSYTDDFRQQTPETLPITWLSGWVKDAEAKKQYEKAFSRSSVESMVNYYKANMPTKDQRAAWLQDPKVPELPTIKVPVLVIFGTKDKYVLKGGLNNTWDYVESDLTMVTLPNAGHFVQQDESELVSKSMRMWLLRD